MAGQPDISVVICTYNRRALLSSALNSLLQQRAGDVNYEIIVVDNNSPPETQALVEELARTDNRLRYLRETRQGNAYARNTGVENARAPIVAFVDDDCTVREDWIEKIQQTFADASVDFIGGKVLPRWENTPPSWLTTAHWAPIAAVDYGNTRFSISPQNPVCLLTANIAFRQNIFQKFGGFSPNLQRAGDSIGSLEDHEYVMRLIRGGAVGLYIPEMVVDAFVGRERMTKSYHRRWHRGHGYFYAVMKDPEWERSNFRLAGVPGHLYKQTVTHAVTWCSRVLTGKADAAFESECGLRFFHGFFLARRKDFTWKPGAELPSR